MTENTRNIFVNRKLYFVISNPLTFFSKIFYAKAEFLHYRFLEKTLASYWLRFTAYGLISIINPTANSSLTNYRLIMNKADVILGIWDGHDAGIAFLQGKKILFASNEERYTRRKLDIGFPKESIKAGLAYLGLNPQDIKLVSYSTTDPAKTLTRWVPQLKERYYKIRRKKQFPSRLTDMQKRFKYFYTEFAPNNLSKRLSDSNIRRNLKKLGIFPQELVSVDHHTGHVYGAYACAPFEDALVISLDGIGDGLSGLIASVKKGKYTILHEQSGKRSFGIFFEHVTNLSNMRELEDEGKVMALADFSIPIRPEDNPLMDYFKIVDGEVKTKYSSGKMYKELKKVLWKYPFEQFAYLAQKTLEFHALEFAKYWIKKSKQKNIILVGGIAANIKLNQKILELTEVSDIFVFPHMGDGGLALGTAAYLLNSHYKIQKLDFHDCFLGPTYSDTEVEAAIVKKKFEYKKVNPAKTGARLIAQGEILFWFQDGMEYGPRALGHRSILTLPGSVEIKDKLNLKIKKRVWYQPFCPSMLLSSARKVLKDIKGTPNEFMTCGYWVKEKYRDSLNAVINIDGSCRPQIVLRHNKVYFDLLSELKKLTGLGVVLNTSYNLHGEPIVNTPDDALRVFELSDVQYIILNNYLVTKN